MAHHYGPRNALSTPCLRGERGHWRPAVTVRLAPLQSFPVTRASYSGHRSSESPQTVPALVVPVRDLLVVLARLHALRLIQAYVEVLDDAGTPDRVRHVATESTNRRSHEAQASDWHQNGILWIAHDVPKKEPLHLGSSGVTTKSGQLSATGGLYGNNESARICPRSRLGKGASR